MIWIYRLFYPLFWAGFWLLSFVNEKILAGCELRKNRPWLHWQRYQRPIWIHCSSGEFEYAKEVIRKIKEALPNEKIMVTYFSPTYSKHVHGFPGIDFASPLPFDTFWQVKEFLNYHQPKCLLISRTDLWPELLYQCQKKGIMSLLFSATLSENSPKIENSILNFVHRWLYSMLTKIYCVSDEDFKALSLLYPSRQLEVAGDSRFDQVLNRIQNPKPLKENLSPLRQKGIWDRFGKAEPKKIFVAGSTWDEDEDVILPALLEESSVALIVAPHEPKVDHIERLQNKIKKLGKTYVLYSEAEVWPKDTVLIIDQIGILADLYSWADLAFVGGSFRKSVHSVMEPLAAGCVTFVGPYHHNNREALQFRNLQIQDVYAVQEVGNPRGFRKAVDSLIHRDLSEVRKGIQDQVLSRAGASQKILNWVAQLTQR